MGGYLDGLLESLDQYALGYYKDQFPSLWEAQQKAGQPMIPPSYAVRSGLGALTTTPIGKMSGVGGAIKPRAIQDATKRVVEAINPASTGDAVSYGGKFLDSMGTASAAEAAKELSTWDNVKSALSATLSYLGL